MLRTNVLLASIMVLPASFLASQAVTSQRPETVLQDQLSPSAAVESNPAPLVLELDRAILVLKRGLKENWETRDQYLTAFEKTPRTDSLGRPVTDAKKYVECAIGAHLRIHQTWDEGPPIDVEVHSTISEFTNWRDEAEQAKTDKTGSSKSEGQGADLQLPPSADLQPLPCEIPMPRKVTISAGVAAGMLKTKVDPVYPAEALKNHASGTVVLQVAISTKGRVEALRVINGPASLQQAALDAVQQWTYRPYLLNNIPVEVETTINVVFAPSR
jgi:TonB family protein